MGEYDRKIGVDGWEPLYGRREEEERTSYAREVEERWRRFLIRARRWNAAHPELVNEFNKLTGGGCVTRSGHLSPKLVRAWQKRHGLSGDGMVNEKTLATARSKEGSKKSTPADPKHEGLSLSGAVNLVAPGLVDGLDAARQLVFDRDGRDGRDAREKSNGSVGESHTGHLSQTLHQFFVKPSELTEADRAKWVDYLLDLHRDLHDQIPGELEALKFLRDLRKNQYLVGATIEAVASAWAGIRQVKVPDDAPLLRVQDQLVKAHSLIVGDRQDLDRARREMAIAVALFREAHRKYLEYLSDIEFGAETVIATLQGIETACDITLTILSAGLGAAEVNGLKLGVRGVFKLVAEQAAKSGFTKTALKAGLVAGATHLVQGVAESVTSYAMGLQSELDIAKVLGEAGEKATMSFLGMLVGGVLSKAFLRTFGEIIGSHVPPEAILKLAEKYGVVGVIPPELFVSKGWRFFVNVAGGACTTVLLTAISTTVDHLRTGGQRPNGEQFVKLVVEQMITNGLIQIIVGSLTHTSIDSRRQVAKEFYKATGWDQKRIEEHLLGIDFTKSVEQTTLRKGSIVAQWRTPDAEQGHYYSDRVYTPSELGIGAKGTDITGRVVDKAVTFYEVTEDVQVLKSSCGPPDDIWSVRGATQPTSGGGQQLFTENRSAFRLILKSGKGRP